MTTTEGLEERLLAVAAQFAERVRQRHGVVGVLLYGSLARGDLSPFSDVDVAIIYQDASLPPYWAEHRLTHGVKVDAVPLGLSRLNAMASAPPQALYNLEYVDWLVLEGLLLGGDRHLLYDPEGAVAEAKRRIQAAASFEAMARRTAATWLREMDDFLSKARESLAAGDAGAAIWMAANVARWARGAIATLARHKELEVAARRAGLDELPPLIRELLAMEAPPVEVVAARVSAAEDLWQHGMTQAWDGILSRLAEAGVEHPLQMELVGDHNLFWPGYRLHELGRVPAEVEYAFRVSRFHLARGNASGANSVLWACGTSEAVGARWTAILKALAAHGHDVSGLINPTLAGVRYQQLAAALDRANDALRPSASTPADARHAVELAGAVCQMVAGVVGHGGA